MHELHPLAEALTRALIEIGPPAVTDWGPAPVQEKVDGDNDLLDCVQRMPPPALVQRIWTNGPCLVATRSQARLPAFAEACQACDLPVAVRRSAGTTVVHHSGTLQLSVGAIQRNLSIEASYGLLTDLLLGALSRLGIGARRGPASGSYCDGRYNILVEDRKLAGTAAFSVVRGGQTTTIAHAVVAIAGDPREDIRRVVAFESALGLRRAYQAEAHSSLEYSLGMCGR